MSKGKRANECFCILLRRVSGARVGPELLARCEGRLAAGPVAHHRGVLHSPSNLCRLYKERVSAPQNFQTLDVRVGAKIISVTYNFVPNAKRHVHMDTNVMLIERLALA